MRTATTQPTAARVQRRAGTECVHHWVIDAPVDDTSRGRCVQCGAEREFTNRYVQHDVSPTAAGRFTWPRPDRARSGGRQRSSA